jgi:uncharacterized protein YbjT (DUF2867 family)
MKEQTAVVLGATGLIGSHVLQLLLQDNTFSTVRILVRKPVQLTHPKLEVQQVIFDNLTDLRNKMGSGDALFCCIGTTNSKVKGDKEAYRKIDYDIPVNAARFAMDAGFKSFLLISSVGSNSSGRNFYIKLKGEVEEAVFKIFTNSVHIFQPSILFGSRSEFRLGEVIGKEVMKALSFLLVGSLNKYKGIEARDVAKAMIAAAKKEDSGVKKYHYNDMMNLIKQDQHPE